MSGEGRRTPEKGPAYVFSISRGLAPHAPSLGSFTRVTSQCLKSKKVSGSKSSNHFVLFEPYDLCFVVTEGFEDLHVVLTEFRGNLDPGWSLRKVPRRAMYFNRLIVLGIFYLADVAISKHVGVIGGVE